MAKEEDTKLRLSNEERITILLKEYELSQKMHNFYANQLWQIGSILIGGSVAGLAVLISGLPRPSAIVSGFALAVSAMAFVFLLTVRRFERITLAHLVRCREIEACLEMRQHIYVDKARCEEIRFTRQNGKEERIKKIPSPRGYTLTQILCFILMAMTLGIAIWYCPWLGNLVS